MLIPKPAHRCDYSFFIIAQTWKQPRGPSGGELVNMTAAHPNNGILFSTEKK